MKLKWQIVISMEKSLKNHGDDSTKYISEYFRVPKITANSLTYQQQINKAKLSHICAEDTSCTVGLLIINKCLLQLWIYANKKIKLTFQLSLISRKNKDLDPKSDQIWKNKFYWKLHILIFINTDYIILSI